MARGGESAWGGDARSVLLFGCVLLIAGLAILQAGDPEDQTRNLQFAVIMAGFAVVSLRLARDRVGGVLLQRPVWVAVGICTVTAGIYYSQSPAPVSAVVRATIYLALALLALAILAAHSRGAWSAAGWLGMVAASGSTIILWGFADLANPPSGSDWELLLYGAFRNVRHLANEAFIVATAGMGLLAVRRRWTAAGWLVTVGALVMIVGTGSRAASSGGACSSPACSCSRGIGGGSRCWRRRRSRHRRSSRGC